MVAMVAAAVVAAMRVDRVGLERVEGTVRVVKVRAE